MMTSARKRAVQVLIDAWPEGVRVSNVTDRKVGVIYWQSADWLRHNGYAHYGPLQDTVRLNRAGLALARELGCEGMP